jgi:hypothetical protein
VTRTRGLERFDRSPQAGWSNISVEVAGTALALTRVQRNRTICAEISSPPRLLLPRRSVPGAPP